MGFDPDLYGKWEDEAPCSCHRSSLRAIAFHRVECDFMDRTAKKWGNAGRVAAGVGSAALAFIPFVGPFLAVGAIAAQAPSWGEDMTHTALQVAYKCDNCGHIAHVNYEILDEGQKDNRWGRYMETYGLENLNGIRTTAYDDIERVFRDMPSSYNFVYNNCKDWVKTMINRL